jgi:hypothetical protein
MSSTRSTAPTSTAPRKFTPSAGLETRGKKGTSLISVRSPPRLLLHRHETGDWCVERDESSSAERGPIKAKIHGLETRATSIRVHQPPSSRGQAVHLRFNRFWIAAREAGVHQYASRPQHTVAFNAGSFCCKNLADRPLRRMTQYHTHGRRPREGRRYNIINGKLLWQLARDDEPEKCGILWHCVASPLSRKTLTTAETTHPPRSSTPGRCRPMGTPVCRRWRRN